MRRDRFIYLALFLVTAAVFWPLRQCRFINFDDWVYITGEPHVAQGLTANSIAWAFRTMDNGNWHPLTWMSWMLDCQLFGMSDGAFHLVNLLFHIVNTLLLFYFLRQLTRDVWPSAIVAALFALHPLHVESVAWVTERKDTLSTFFGLLTLISYVRYARQREDGGQRSEGGRQKTEDRVQKTESGLRYYLLTLLLFTLGLMSKPMLVTWPFVLLLLDYWPLRRFAPAAPKHSEGGIHDSRFTIWRLLLEKLPFLALSIASSAVTLFAQRGAVTSGTRQGLLERVASALISYARYLSKTFWPSDLAIYYPFPPSWPAWQIAVAAILIISITAGTVWAAKSRPYLIFGWLWFLGTLVPVIGLVSPNSFFMADRYMYVPSIGIFVMIAWGVKDMVSRWPALRPWTIAASTAVLAGCMVVTVLQLRYWQNTEVLFRHTVAVTPPNAMARQVLGKVLTDKGQIDEGLEHLNEALRIDPTYSAPHAVIAEVMQDRGNIREAVYHYREGLRYKPNSTPMLNNLAWILATNGDSAVRDGAEAVRLAESACLLSGYNSVLFIGTLGAAYAEAGRFDDAIRAAEKARDMAAASGVRVLADRNEQLLALFRQGKPYHEPPVRQEGLSRE